MNKSDELEEKFEQFGEKVIDLAKKVQKNNITMPIVSQFIRSGTSIGANYMEANGASSKQDFRNKIYICKKEAKETMHWLRMLARADDKNKDECRILWQETKGYAKLFSSITATLRNKSPKQEIVK